MKSPTRLHGDEAVAQTDLFFFLGRIPLMLSARLTHCAKILAILGLAALPVAFPSAVNAGPVGYTLDVTTFYQFGSPPDLNFADFGAGSPDTGYWRITNNGGSTFTGSIGQVAVSNGNGDNSYSHVVSLNPGASVVFAVDSESSNVGGFNGPSGSTQPGVQINLNGTISLGANNESVMLSVNDSDIHSGVPRTNPFGVTLDNYVLQGGDPFGNDTGDGYETSQAPGHFQFFEAPSSIPEPTSIALIATGLIGFVGTRLRSRSRR
jgi:hypothetical protein